MFQLLYQSIVVLSFLPSAQKQQLNVECNAVKRYLVNCTSLQTMKVDIDIDGSTNLKCYCTLQFDVKCDHKIRFDVDNLLPVDKHAFLESSRKKVGMDNT